MDALSINLEGKLATIHIPWDEIEEYSDRYNPSVLVLDEMRLVDTVDIAVAIKTYPDGKLTGKIRANLPIAHTVAGYFGGGGHEYASGFKVNENYDTILKELLSAVEKALAEYGTQLHNQLTRKVDDFAPQEAGKVSLLHLWTHRL